MMRALSVSVLLLAGILPAQDLRHGVAAADLVVLAKDIGVRPVGKHYLVHALRIERTLAGVPQTTISVVEIKGVSLHQRPAPAELRLYCLHDFAARAGAAGLPASMAPYYKMNGHAGSNPAIADPKNDPALQLAEIVLASADGAAARDIATKLHDFALKGPATGLRTEAVFALGERPALTTSLTPMQMSGLMARAVGEIADIPFKTALVRLCAERRVPDLIDSVCIGAGAVESASFWRTVGRIARDLHGEDAIEVLRPHITKTRDADARGRLVLALGATSTQRALDALLRMRAAGAKDRYVVDALKAHGSAQALDAIK